MAIKSSKWKISLQQKGQLPSIKKHFAEILQITADVARNEWVKAARASLGSTLGIYLSGLGQPQMKGGYAEIKLTGHIPNAIEEGCGPFDMKPGFLRSSGVKYTSSGKAYFTVPFGMKTPGARGPLPPVMPSSIYRLASKLQFGDRLNLPVKFEGYGVRTRLSPDSARYGSYTWKSSPYQGMVREQRFPGELSSTPAGQMAVYKTFRRVSKKSNPNSWIHPGFRAKHVMEQAAARLEQKFPEILAKIFG